MSVHSVIQYVPFHDALIYTPVSLAYNIVYSSVYFVGAVIAHTVVIPLFLTLNIMVYTPFFRLPVVEPLRWILELQDSRGNLQDYEWMYRQFSLFFITALHFVLVAVFAGIFVGVVSGYSLRTIRFFFTLLTHRPKPAKIVYNWVKSTATPWVQEYTSSLTVASRNPPVVVTSPSEYTESEFDSVAATPALSTKPDSVLSTPQTVNQLNLEPISPPYSPEADLVGAEQTTSSSVPARSVQRLRDRILNKNVLIGQAAHFPVYEDDDGYSYANLDKDPEDDPAFGVGPPHYNYIIEESEGEFSQAVSENVSENEEEPQEPEQGTSKSTDSSQDDTNPPDSFSLGRSDDTSNTTDTPEKNTK